MGKIDFGIRGPSYDGASTINGQKRGWWHIPSASARPMKTTLFTLFFSALLFCATAADPDSKADGESAKNRLDTNDPTLLNSRKTMNSTSQPLGLRNAFVRATRDKRLKIIVIGNSVTNGAPVGKDEKKNPSFYVSLGDWFTKKFPEAQIEVVPRIIFAMGPEVQVFRMDERVIAEKPDLVLVEFNAASGAANSAWGENGPKLTDPASEGFFRRLRLLLPQTDCLIEMALFKTMLDDYRHGKDPLCASFQHAAAAHYGNVYADAGKEVAARILAGEPWEAYMNDGIHPNDQGYEIYSKVLLAEVERQWTLFLALPESEKTVTPHAMPATTLCPDPWLFARLVPAYNALHDAGFKVEETGPAKYLAATQVGASGSFDASPGRIVGVLMRYPGESCGNLELRSGDHWVRLSQKQEPHFTHGEDSANHYIRALLGANGLPLSLDKIEFRVSNDPEVAGASTVEIIGFMVVERPALD